MNHFLKTIIFVSLFATHAYADDWTSEDGKISVAVPDASRFVQAEADRPVSVIWVSTDETVKLGVAEVPFRPGIKLVQSSVEKGLAKEIGGEIIDSRTDQRAGHDVLLMTCHGQALESEVYLTQAVVAVDDKVYKVMAIGVGQDTRTDLDAAAFVSSFKILTTGKSRNFEPQRNSQPVNQVSNDSLVDQLSQRIGSVSLIVLVVCLIAIAIREISKTNKRRFHII